MKDNIDCLESVIPLVSFREWLISISRQEHILDDEEISVFKHLFEATSTWKSCGCDLVRISAINADNRDKNDSLKEQGSTLF